MSMSMSNMQLECVENIEFDIKCNDIEEAGILSTTVKKILRTLKVNKSIIRRVSIACYEAEINVVIHSVGGKAHVSIIDNYLEIQFLDKGPGIEDIELAMQKGYSTASQYARNNGFGAGMGLPNIKESSDDFEITSSASGTKLVIGFNLGEIEI